VKQGTVYYGVSSTSLDIVNFEGVLLVFFLENSNKFAALYLGSSVEATVVLDKIKKVIRKIKDDGFKKEDVVIKCISSYISFGVISDYIKSLKVRYTFKVIENVVSNIKIDSTKRLVLVGKAVDTSTLKIKNKMRVLIVDDSSTMRKVLREMLSNNEMVSDIEEASDAFEAKRLIVEKKPDVITLDINMPGMDGVTFLKQYIKEYPIPTIMVTSFNLNDSGHILEALESGAFDYIEKPSFKEIKTIKAEFLDKVVLAFEAKKKIAKIHRVGISQVAQRLNSSDVSKYLLVIGSSTGGTEALKEILTALPDIIPPTLIVQHIPPVFSKAFADRMNDLCHFTVKEAQDGDLLGPNKVIVARGGQHLKLCERDGMLFVNITDDPPVNRFRPSVDFLFNSIVEIAPKKNIIAALLTGMGNDGAKGLLGLKSLGAYTIAQDEESSVVFGMPKAAITLGAHCQIESLDKIAGLIVKKISEGAGRCISSKLKVVA